MKKRLLCMFLAICLVCGMAVSVSAASPADMTDISGHWAYENICWAMEQGLFTGVDSTTFKPNGSMTRGMFVAVLGRFAGVDAESYQGGTDYNDVPADQYYAPYVNWATEKGIVNGSGDGTFRPNAKVTREQMATMLVRFAQYNDYELTAITDTVVDSFADVDKVSSYALEAVETMRQTGLITGRANKDGSYSFDPRANATRAECATLFRRLDQSLVSVEPEAGAPTGVSLDQTELVLLAGQQASLTAVIEPEDAVDQTLTWKSIDSNVAKVDENGVVTAMGLGQTRIWVYTANGKSAWCHVSVNSYVASAEDSYATRCIGVFGEYVDDPRHVYADEDEAEANMVTIAVKVWDFTNSSHTTKTTKTRYVDVNKNIAETVKRIFEEIYACEAQYPVSDLGGYHWSSSSEHTSGIAIDINVDANPYCDPEGNVLVGEAFDPENNPYSIPIDGEVQQIFEKYGFRRGIYWNSGYKDYMHFSLFGT